MNFKERRYQRFQGFLKDNDDKIIQNYLSRFDQVDVNILFETSCEHGDLIAIKKLHPLVKHTSINEALEQSAKLGYIDVVEFLIPYTDCINSKALSYASQRGYLEMVKLLLPHSDVDRGNGDAIKCAVQGGHIDVVEFLLPHSKIEELGSMIFVRCCWREDVEMMRLLHPYFNTDGFNTLELEDAIKNKNYKTIEFFASVSNKNIINNALSKIVYRGLESEKHIIDIMFDYCDRGKFVNDYKNDIMESDVYNKSLMIHFLEKNEARDTKDKLEIEISYDGLKKRAIRKI